MSIEDLDKNVNVNFRVPLAYREALKQKAASQGINLSKFFRNCMDEALNDNSTNVLPSKLLDKKPDIVLSIRINDPDFYKFQDFCNKYHKDYGKVIRAFICTIADSFVNHKRTEIESTLFYLILFLSSVMEREGFFPALEDIQTIKTSSEHPLIQEDGKGKTRLFRVYDKDKSVIHIIPFRKG